jgi:hypothetical protein
MHRHRRCEVSPGVVAAPLCGATVRPSSRRLAPQLAFTFNARFGDSYRTAWIATSNDRYQRLGCTAALGRLQKSVTW